MQAVMTKAQELAEAILNSECYQSMKKTEAEAANTGRTAGTITGANIISNTGSQVAINDGDAPMTVGDANTPLAGAEETANGTSLIYLLSSMALAMMIALSIPAVLRRRNDGSEK